MTKGDRDRVSAQAHRLLCATVAGGSGWISGGPGCETRKLPNCWQVLGGFPVKFDRCVSITLMLPYHLCDAAKKNAACPEILLSHRERERERGREGGREGLTYLLVIR
jgi:hypothetical protein